MPNYQGVWSLTTQMQNVSGWPEQPLGGGGRAVFSLGDVAGTIVNTLKFTTILTGSTFTDFGDSTVTAEARNSLSSDTRGVTGGKGALRIVYSFNGTTRTFPTTNVGP